MMSRGTQVAASIGPYGAILHDGSEFVGRYGLSVDALVAFHAERMSVLGAATPDVLAIETIPCLDEVRAVCRVLAALEPEVPAWLSLSGARCSRPGTAWEAA